MRSWWWGTYGQGDRIRLKVEFQSENAVPPNLKELVRSVGLHNFVRAAPEVVASFKSRDGSADYYYDNYTYSRLYFFTGRGYYGPYSRIVVTDTTLQDEIYGGTAKYDPQQHKPDATTRLIAMLIQEQKLRVKHWRVTVDYLEDGGNYPPKYVAEGDHQTLIEYLGLDKPEQEAATPAAQEETLPLLFTEE